MRQGEWLETEWTPRVGDQLPVLQRGPISRWTLAMFAGASNDHSPLHVDSDFVKAAGMPDVFAHGMLIMAYLGHLLTQVVRQEDIRSWKVRFVSITPVHSVVSCSGQVREVLVVQGESRAVLDIAARTQDGEVKVVGEAVIAFGQTHKGPVRRGASRLKFER